MVVIPCNRALYDLAVHAVMGRQIVFGRPLFEIEEIAEELIGIVFRKQFQSNRRAEMPFEQRGRLCEVGQHPRRNGLKYVFPPARGSLVRGVPTAAAVEPLKSRLLEDGEPPIVWSYAEGTVRGISIAPLYKGAPKAALLDSRFYEVLALSDAIRSGRTRERNLAVELLKKEIHV